MSKSGFGGVAGGGWLDEDLTVIARSAAAVTSAKADLWRGGWQRRGTSVRIENTHCGKMKRRILFSHSVSLMLGFLGVDRII